jgi:hypothetical protein
MSRTYIEKRKPGLKGRMKACVRFTQRGRRPAFRHENRLSRFTIDPLMPRLDRLNQDVEVAVSVQHRRAAPARLASGTIKGAFSNASTVIAETIPLIPA